MISLAACGTKTNNKPTQSANDTKNDSVKSAEVKLDTNVLKNKPLSFEGRLCSGFTAPLIKVDYIDSIKPDSIEVDTSKVYTVVEQMPVFPGGEVELLKFIMQNLKNPSVNGEEMVQGKVICRFIVDIDGSVIKPEVTRSLDRDFDAEALRVIRLLPKFTPGKQNHKLVRVYYVLPVTFKLE